MSNAPLLTGHQGGEGTTAYHQKMERRRAQLREAQARRRARLQRQTVFIELSKEEKDHLQFLKYAQAGDLETFYKRALIVGAKFLYNSGNKRGGKARIKGDAQ